MNVPSTRIAVRMLASALALAAAIAATPSAYADDLAESDGFSRLVTPLQGWRIAMTISAGLASDQIFEPTTLASDAIYGAARSLEIGVAHSTERTSGFTATALSGGFCVTGKARGCRRPYDGPALVLRYQLNRGSIELALDGGLVTVSIADPLALSAKVGVTARISTGRWALAASPNLRTGLTGRELDSGAAFNEERVNLPVWIGARLSSMVHLGLESGARAFAREFGDTLEVPVAATVGFGLSPTLAVSVAGGFDSIIANGPDGRTFDADRRVIAFVFSSRI